MHYVHTCKLTCSQQIEFDLNGDIVTNIVFHGGCPGNTKAVAKLLEGKTVDYIVKTLKGNTCGFRTTSCADQLAIGVQEAYDKASK